MLQPGLCSPSRSVVSKMMTRFGSVGTAIACPGLQETEAAPELLQFRGRGYFVFRLNRRREPAPVRPEKSKVLKKNHVPAIRSSL